MVTFEDELLVAALNFILNVPDEFVNISAHCTALQRALELGFSHEPCVHVALQALERWIQLQEHESRHRVAFRNSMQQLVPLLFKYLNPQVLVEKAHDHAQELEANLGKQTHIVDVMGIVMGGGDGDGHDVGEGDGTGVDIGR